MHESGYFTLTIEYAGGNTWRNSAVFDADISKWKCDNYLKAVHSDKDFFDNDYEESIDSYKAMFRGRGLIQLTHCHNYMQFFYHIMSKKQGYDHLKEGKFTYTHKGINRPLRQPFCDKEELKSIAKAFERDGLYLPTELITNFENTVDRLSLPCNLTTVSFMQGPEFIVDSAFWFWNRCDQRYPSAYNDPSDRAVGVLSGCVHGASKFYRRFDKTWCRDGVPDGNMMEQFLDEVRNQRAKNSRATILTSYCGRLHNFNAFMGCFETL